MISKLPDQKAILWGYGAVGSASAWHAEGQGFEYPRVENYTCMDNVEQDAQLAGFIGHVNHLG